MKYICTECGCPCDGAVVDFGIGPYEFWGRTGVDTQSAFVSVCCEADMTDEQGNIIEADDYDNGDDYWDYWDDD